MSGGWGCGACGGANPDGTRYCGHCGTPSAAGDLAADRGGERRLITALFADLSGFTTLADRLEAEQLHDVISPVITRLAAVAEQYGGTIAKYAGDALLVFFGAPVAQEDHAERALHVAIDMHDELRRIVDTLDDDADGLQLHIGVNTGHVVAGMFGGDLRADYSILGDATNTAQRLESNAPPGETYVGESTVILTGDRFELESVGELALKGKPLPVPAWRLVGRRAAPADRGHAPPTRLIGRTDELAALDSGVANTTAGGGIAAVVGEPGVGKSRLAEELRPRAEARGARWFEARCSPYAVGVAYWPYVDLVRRAFDITIDQDPLQSARALAAALSDIGVPEAEPYLGRLLALPSTGTTDVDELVPAAFRRALHGAIRSTLAALTRSGPVVLAMEDLHWCDPTSVELTLELTELCATLPLTLYVTSRPEGGSTVDALVAAAPQIPSRSVALRPLGTEGVTRLLTELLRDAPSPDLVAHVIERTGGNPFFVQELVSSLRDVHGLVHTPAGWHSASPAALDRVPDTVEGVLAARMDLLGRAAVTVLQTAAAIGRRVDRTLLEASVDDLPDVAGALDQLVRGGFLDRDPSAPHSFVFRHALVVDVAYGRLVRRQRCQVHRRVGEAAEVLYGTADDVVDLLARHFRLAEAGVKAAMYLERTAARARRLYANEEASAHLAAAADIARMTPRLVTRLPALLLERADVEELVGRLDVAEKLYAEVRDLTDDSRAWCGLAAVARKRGEYDSALDLVATALTGGRWTIAEEAALALERAWALSLSGRQAEAVPTLEAAIGRLGDQHDHVRALLLFTLARNEELMGRLDLSLAHARAAESLFEVERDAARRASALRLVGGVLYRFGRLDEARAALERARQLARRVGSAEEIAASLLNLGLVLLASGSVDEAIACDRDALAEFRRTGLRGGVATAHVNLAEKLLVAGELDDALLECAHGRDEADAIGNRIQVAESMDTEARILLASGRPHEAAALAIEAADVFLEMQAPVLAGRALHMAADAWDAEGDATAARSTRDRAAALLGSSGDQK